MITFRIDDMTCGHCVDTITRALHVLDPAIEDQLHSMQNRALTAE